MAMAEALLHVPGVDVRATPHIWEISDQTVEDIREFARHADLIVGMPVSKQSKPGLGTAELLAISKCAFVVHPNIHFEGSYPTFDYVRNDEKKHLELGKLNNPFGDYFCFLLYTFWADGKSSADCYELLQLPNPTELVKGFYMHSLDNLRIREAESASSYLNIRSYEFVRVSQFFEEDRFDLEYFDTFNHPSSMLLKKFLDVLIDTTELKTILRRRGLNNLSSIKAPVISEKLRLPVYQLVANSLGLKGRQKAFFVNCQGATESLESMIDRSYEFFSRLTLEEIRLIHAEPKLGLGRLYANHILKSS